MWCKNPFDRGGWWGKNGNWYASGWGGYSHWFTEKAAGAYRQINWPTPFVQHPKIHHFAQKAMFHGAIPNPGFPPLSFYPQS